MTDTELANQFLQRFPLAMTWDPAQNVFVTSEGIAAAVDTTHNLLVFLDPSGVPTMAMGLDGSTLTPAQYIQLVQSTGAGVGGTLTSWFNTLTSNPALLIAGGVLLYWFLFGAPRGMKHGR